MKELDARDGRIGQLLRDDACSLFYRLAHELPGEPVLLDLGIERLLVCQDVDSTHAVLRENPDNFHKNFGAFSAFFGSSRLTTDGEHWRKLQKVGQPLIAAIGPSEIARETQAQYKKGAAQILEDAKSNPIVNIDHFIDQVASSVVMKAIFGVDISDLPLDFYASLRTVLNHCGKASLDYASSFQGNHPERVKIDSAFKNVKSTVSSMIAEGRRKCQGTNSPVEVFFSSFPSDAELFGEFITLLFAGFDTTSSTLCWALMLLASQSELQEQLRRELQEITADAELTGDLSSKSATLMAFINETFRMFPAIPILSRSAVGEAHVGGTQVQAGQKILISIIGLHQDRNFWPMPSKFDIGRFPDGEVASDRRRHLMPFSAGQRVCGGSKFAMTEISVALATLLRHLRFEPAERQPVRFQWGASMRHSDGIRLIVSANTD